MGLSPVALWYLQAYILHQAYKQNEGALVCLFVYLAQAQVAQWATGRPQFSRSLDVLLAGVPDKSNVCAVIARWSQAHVDGTSLHSTPLRLT
jgi:hypothetical protein